MLLGRVSASLEADLKIINSQIHRIEIKIKILESELSRLLAEEKNSVTGNEVSSEEEFFFEDVSPSVKGKIKQSIASHKAYENQLDDSRAAKIAQAEYQEYLREQERQRMAMKKFAAGMQSVGRGLQQVHARSMQFDEQLEEMARKNRQNTAAAMNAYSNAYEEKMESSGYNEWKKSITAQVSGKYYKPNSYGKPTSGNRYRGSGAAKKAGYSAYKNKGHRSQTSYTSGTPAPSGHSVSKQKKRNWWVMCEVKANDKGGLKSTNYFLKQSNTMPQKRITRKSQTGLVFPKPFTYNEARARLNKLNSSPLKMNIKSEKDAEKKARNLHNLMMKNPEFRKKFLKKKAQAGF